MSADDDQEQVVRLPTLGQRLDHQARRMIARTLPTFGWAVLLQSVLHRATHAAASTRMRFERVEAAPGAAAPPHAVPAGRAVTPRTTSSAPPASSPGGGRGAQPVRPPAAMTTPRPLPAALRERLRPLAGAAAGVLRVRDDDVADALARTHRADAVTIGADVHFRHGQFRPHEERGFALLAHEARHVLALLEPSVTWRRATSAGQADEESDARAVERRVLTGARGGVTIQRPSWPVPLGVQAPHPLASADRPISAPSPGATASTSRHPMAAAPDRDVGAPAHDALDVAALRRDLMAELMHRLRTEFERGG